MDKTPSKMAVSQGMGETPNRAPSGVESAQYRLSVKVECTAGCLTEYYLLITAQLLLWIVQILQGFLPQKKLRHQMRPPGSGEWSMLEALVRFGDGQKELPRFCLVSSLWGVF